MLNQSQIKYPKVKVSSNQKRSAYARNAAKSTFLIFIGLAEANPGNSARTAEITKTARYDED